MAMPEGWRQVDSFTRDLSLAVQLTDGVVGGRPVGNPTVRVQGVDEEPFRNRSGYFLFFDLPEEEVTVTVDGGDSYFDASQKVPLDPAASDTHDTGEAVELTLEPTPSYQFPAGLTRVRGTVWDGSSRLSGVTVSVDSSSRSTTTTAAGEFVYYFDDIDRANISVESSTGDRLYRPGGSDPTFVVDGGPPGGFSQSVRVEVGRLTIEDLKP